MSIPRVAIELSQLKSHAVAASTEAVELVVDVLPFAKFDAPMRSEWQRLRQSASVFRSPFFSLEFLDATAAARDDARMIVAKVGSRIAGMLPIQLATSGHALPLGGLFNDAHGLLYDPSRDKIRYLDLLRLAKLKSYTFHALTPSTSEVKEWQFGVTRSFLADLQRHSNGYVPFLEECRETIFKQRRKTKKMIKDLGPLRLELDCRSPEVHEQILELKRSQYRRTHIFDILSVDWVHRVFNQLFADSVGGQCRGITSVLWAGETLVAGHIGLIEKDLLHYWFPVYDPNYHAYSPGTALFLEIAKACEERGVRQIDFGYGEQPYKTKLTDTISEMHYGRFDVSRSRWLYKRAAYHIAMKRKQLPFREQIKRVLRTLSPNFGAKRYQ